MKAVTCFFVMWLVCPVLALGHYTIQSIVNDQVHDLNGQLIPPVASPTVGGSYGCLFGWETEHSETGESMGIFLGWQNGQIAELTMDGVSETVATDFANLVEPGFTPNDIIATESLEVLDVDKTSGRFILRLTVSVSTTADPNATQWDSFEFDLRDPLDIDNDGETGSGPDGIFGTEDDVIEQDGVFDAGDGSLDAPMPLDPPGLVEFFICEDEGDCGPDGLTLIRPVTPVFSVGRFSSLPIQFDADAGEIVPLAVYLIMEDFDGGFADLNRDGQPGLGEFVGDFDSNEDGLADSIRTVPDRPLR